MTQKIASILVEITTGVTLKQ